MFVLQSLCNVYDQSNNVLENEWVDACDTTTGVIFASRERAVLEGLEGQMISGFGFIVIRAPKGHRYSARREFRIVEADRIDNTAQCEKTLQSFLVVRSEMVAAKNRLQATEVDLDAFHAARIGGDEK